MLFLNGKEPISLPGLTIDDDSWIVRSRFPFADRQDILGQFSMVNLELFNIVEDIKKVSKAFVVHPKYVNAENAPSTISFLNR